MSGERQVPFFCPYCGEENLRPASSDAGEWECRACSRGFSLKFVAVVRPQPYGPVAWSAV
jgi:ribosomal protein L37AE/L43A